MAGARPDQRQRFLDGAVEHVLQHGVATLSLRPLAAALGTSDRMLLYYFHTRDELLVAVLEAVNVVLQGGLGSMVGSDVGPPAALLRRATELLDAPAVQPHLRLYVEVSGLAARGTEPFATIAAAVAHSWTEWLGAHLDVAEERRAESAAGLLAMIDGLLLVRFVAGTEIAGRAARFFAVELGEA